MSTALKAARFAAGRAAMPVVFVLGAIAVAGFEPIGLSLLSPLTLTALFCLLAVAENPRRAALLGFLWGLGHFLTGVSWVYVSLHVYGQMPAPVAALATIAFCAYLALFPALAGSLCARFGAAPPALRAAILLPSFWVLGEWLRSWLLTGFPWLATGYSQTDTPLAGFAPLAGLYGVSLATAISAGLLAAAILVRETSRRLACIGAIVIVVAGGAMLRSTAWTVPEGDPLDVALVQGNVPQNLKFDPVRYRETLASYARLVESSKAKLIVLPETAIPRLLDSVDPRYLDRLAEHAYALQGDLLLGAPFRVREGNYYNGVVNLGATATQFYAKRHLVPLGEFVPAEFAWIVALMQMPLSDFSRGADTQAPMRAAGVKVALTVCYEDAFGEELIAQLPEATVLANLSNVAWFGDSLAPDQHLQISRMRSIETGRPMVRATNTGATAAIDERGRVIARLPPFTEGVLHAKIQPFTGATPYVRLGNAPALAAAALLALAAILFTRARSRAARQSL